MLKNVGLSRIIFIVFILFLNGAFFCSSYFYLIPQKQEADRGLATVKLNVQSKQAEIVQLREDFNLLKERLKEFSALELSGFFEAQNRLSAKEKIEDFRFKADLLNVSMLMDSGEILENVQSLDANHVLLKSSFSVKINAQDDLDVMYFLKLMQEGFPGVVEFETIDIKRIKNLNAPLLRLIGSGVPEALVVADVKMNWVTMPSQEDLQ